MSEHRVDAQTCLGASTLVGLLWAMGIAKENDAFFCVSRLIKSFRRPWRVRGLSHLLSSAGDREILKPSSNRIVRMIYEFERKVRHIKERGFCLPPEVEAIAPVSDTCSTSLHFPED